MDEEKQEEKQTATVLSRHRSPTFSKDEVKVLIDIIDKYKNIVLNKSTSAAASHAKETAWAKIAKLFNNQGFKHSRSADSLKTKWENLKKDARKLSKNLIDVEYSEFDELTSQIVTMMCEGENSTSTVEVPQDINDELIETDEHKESTDNSVKKSFWDECGDKQSDESVDGDNESRMIRSLNFSPQECSLLLKCVREEKKLVFCKETTGKAIKLKNRAWSRITDVFNKQSPHKRSTKVLRTKFNNMKRMARTVSFKDYLKDFGSRKHEKLINESSKNIKSEPVYDYKLDIDSDHDGDNDYYSIHNASDNSPNGYAPDPLSIVLNGNSGSLNHIRPLNRSENKEIIKLKIELLKYQMETAKLERKRLEDAIQAERSERELRATESSLRLRAARLDAVAAEMRLPPAHPALHYTAEELCAQQYLHQYQQT